MAQPPLNKVSGAMHSDPRVHAPLYMTILGYIEYLYFR